MMGDAGHVLGERQQPGHEYSSSSSSSTAHDSDARTHECSRVQAAACGRVMGKGEQHAGGEHKRTAIRTSNGLVMAVEAMAVRQRNRQCYASRMARCMRLR